MVGNRDRTAAAPGGVDEPGSTSRHSALVVDISPGYLARFIRVTAVLAMPAELQEKWLATFSGGEYVDELALDWDGGWRLMPQWVERGWLSAEDAGHFRPLDEALAEMSGKEHAELWTTAALHRAPEWVRIRELATAALFNL